MEKQEQKKPEEMTNTELYSAAIDERKASTKRSLRWYAGALLTVVVGTIALASR